MNKPQGPGGDSRRLPTQLGPIERLPSIQEPDFGWSARSGEPAPDSPRAGFDLASLWQILLKHAAIIGLGIERQT